MRITRLGQGVDATGRARPGRRSPARSAVLAEYRAAMDERRAWRGPGWSPPRPSATRPTATSSSAPPSRRPAWTAELLSGDEEGRLAYAGATADLPAGGRRRRRRRHRWRLDRAGRRAPRKVRAVSLDLGCVRLTERFLRHDPPTGHELEAAAAYRPPSSTGRGRHCRSWPLGAGSADRSGRHRVDPGRARIRGSSHYDRDRIHHSVLGRDHVDRWCDVLAAEPAAARAVARAWSPGART